MIDALLLVLRETLEASLLTGFLFVCSQYLGFGNRWFLYALIVSLVSAFIHAHFFSIISNAFDGLGQEIFFASILTSLSFIILAMNFGLLSVDKSSAQQGLKWLFGLTIILALSLEGAEIILYLQSRYFAGQLTQAVVTGSVIGLGIGLSCGVVAYFLFLQNKIVGFYISSLMLALVSAGMLVQAESYLMQSDIIDSGIAVWSTDDWVSERSIFGQLLYAVIGYESTPTLVQVLSYGFLLVIYLSLVVRHFKFKRKAK